MKKNLTIILIVIIVLLGGFLLALAFGYFNNENLPQGIRGLFPSGEDVPFSGYIDTNNDDEGSPSQNENSGGTVFSSSRFTQIFAGEVSGYTVIKKVDVKNVRFIEKEKGNLYDYNKETGTLTKISNQTMPGINDVVWSNDGDTFIARQYNEGTNSIKNTLVSFEKNPTSSNFYTFTQTRKEGETGNDILFLQKTLNANPLTQISGEGPGSPGKETSYLGARTKEAIKKFQTQENLSETGILDDETILKINEVNKFLFGKQNENVTETPLLTRDLGNINEATKNENGEIFYIKQAGTQTEGFKDSMAFKNPLMIFKNPLLGWIVEWPTKNGITLQTKSSGKSPGYLYLLNPTTGAVTNVLENIYGLTAKTNREGNLVLYSATDSYGKNLSTFVFDTTKNESINLQIKTFAEKCVWGVKNTHLVFCAVPEKIGDETLPDSWYQGKEKFNDRFWMIDVTRNTGTLLFENERKSLRESLDVQNLSLGEDEDTLYMVNKKDASLWSLRLGE